MRSGGRAKFIRNGKFYVYILQCADETYYTGYTRDVEKRLKEHNAGKRGAKYTRYKRPVRLVWCKEYEYKHYAMKAECKIKVLNRRQKELLIGGMRLDKVMSRKGWQPKVFIKTFGCQMNLRDSEIIKGLLLDTGFGITEEEENADAVLFVTCSVRQHAEDKVWSEIGRFSQIKPKPVIGLIGCMAENYKEEAFRRMPGIDLVVGTNNIGEIPRLLKEIFHERRETRDEGRRMKDVGGVLAVSKKERDEFVYRPAFRAEKKHSFVVISEGCDNFCSYCVVPYVRGGLRHRKPENILKEIQCNIEKGITSVTLIGQNVNTYQYNGTDFVALLEKVNSLKGLEEFSFVTSHPKDVADNLFKAMAGLDRLKKYLHLPAQSGSDRILKLMKRGYGIRQYLALADSYRKEVSGGALTTDFIVGFPGETEEDFQRTLDLLNEVRFNSAYIFKYSPRPHTEAAKIEDDVPREEKERRHKILLETQKQISKELKK